MIKAKEATRTEYAHMIYVANNEAGMRTALDYVGYKDSIIIVQEYVPHYE